MKLNCEVTIDDAFGYNFNRKQEAQSHSDIFRQCGGKRFGQTSIKSFLAHTPKVTKNISMEILSTELKPIALEIIQFENRHNNIN